MAGARTEIAWRRLVANGLFNVRSLWKQSGVRVSSAGHVRLRGLAAKILRDLNLPPSARSFFHHLGWRQLQ